MLARVALSLALILLSLPRSARADSTFCNEERIAVTGQDTATVRESCGNPTQSSWHLELRRLSRFCNRVVRIDEWIYLRGEAIVPRRLVFENGVLASIAVYYPPH